MILIRITGFFGDKHEYKVPVQDFRSLRHFIYWLEESDIVEKVEWWTIEKGVKDVS